MGFANACAFLHALDAHRELVAEEFDTRLGNGQGNCKGKGCNGGAPRSAEDDFASALATLPAALAERLQLRHHSTVELIDRLVDRGMLLRRPGAQDRRQVHIELRPSGEAVLNRLVLYSLKELETEGPALVAALSRLVGGSRPGRRRIESRPKSSVGSIRARPR